MLTKKLAMNSPAANAAANGSTLLKTPLYSMQFTSKKPLTMFTPRFRNWFQKLGPAPISIL